MTYFLETCDPDEFYDNNCNWTIRDTARDKETALDILQSPMFDAYDTLLARVTQGLSNHAHGVYYGGEFHSTRYDSDLKKRHDALIGNSIFFARNEPITIALRLSVYPENFVDIVQPYVDPRLIIKAMILSMNENSSFSSMMLSWCNRMLTTAEARGYAESFNGDAHKVEIARFFLENQRKHYKTSSSRCWNSLRIAAQDNSIDSQSLERLREFIPMRVFLRGLFSGYSE